jgi:hypothetical protein
MSTSLDTGSSEEPRSPSTKSAEIAAAVIIQRLWRSRNNRAKRQFLTSETRWQDAIVEAEFEV